MGRYGATVAGPAAGFSGRLVRRARILAPGTVHRLHRQPCLDTTAIQFDADLSGAL
jgi:hypothetical protein